MLDSQYTPDGEGEWTWTPREKTKTPYNHSISSVENVSPFPFFLFVRVFSSQKRKRTINLSTSFRIDPNTLFSANQKSFQPKFLKIYQSKFGKFRFIKIQIIYLLNKIIILEGIFERQYILKFKHFLLLQTSFVIQSVYLSSNELLRH